eukprot:15366014-Ditylum_brightwellii.AAC.1
MYLRTVYLVGKLRDMAPEARKFQRQNAVQNHQNSEPLPVLDTKVEQYEPVELYQWEMCVQLHL